MPDGNPTVIVVTTCFLFSFKQSIFKKINNKFLLCNLIIDKSCLFRIFLPAYYPSLQESSVNKDRTTNHGGTWRTMHCRLCINCYGSASGREVRKN
jgi:hypothetical protein